MSNDLTQLTIEIKTYQSIGGRAIFEIGRRLKWVKEHDLAHGEFGKWLESVGMSGSQARKFMKVADEFSNRSLGNDLGVTVLYEIATLPAPEKEKAIRKVENGQKITRSEVEMFKRKLKEKEQALQDKDSQISKQAEMIDRLSEREPKVVEKTVTVEKTPDDYELIKQKAQQADSIREQLSKAQKQADYFKNEYDSLQQIKQIEDGNDDKKLERLKRKADINIYTLSYNIKNFINSNMLLDDDLKQLSEMSEDAKSNISSRLDELQKFIDLIRQSTSGRKIIEGSFEQ